MRHTIEHSGWQFRSVGTGKVRRAPIWPIQEYLVRTKHGPAVRERIARLNPNGKEEGERPRGWHPSFLFRAHGKRAKVFARKMGAN
jgi:hypothetical protein